MGWKLFPGLTIKLLLSDSQFKYTLTRNELVRVKFLSTISLRSYSIHTVWFIHFQLGPFAVMQVELSRSAKTVHFQSSQQLLLVYGPLLSGSLKFHFGKWPFSFTWNRRGPYTCAQLSVHFDELLITYTRWLLSFDDFLTLYFWFLRMI